MIALKRTSPNNFHSKGKVRKKSFLIFLENIYEMYQASASKIAIWKMLKISFKCNIPRNSAYFYKINNTHWNISRFSDIIIIIIITVILKTLQKLLKRNFFSNSSLLIFYAPKLLILKKYNKILVIWNTMFNLFLFTLCLHSISWNCHYGNRTCRNNIVSTMSFYVCRLT